VSRRHRVVDLVSTLLIVAGGILYGVSYVGMERIRSAPDVGYARGMVIDQLARYHRFAALSWVALGAVALGIAIGVYAWRRHRRGGRSRD